MSLSINTGSMNMNAGYQVQTNTSQKSTETDKAKESLNASKKNKETTSGSGEEYTAVSAHGDTLQISSAGATAYENSEQQQDSSADEQTNIAKIVSETVDTDSDSSSSSSDDLSSYTATELKQMYQNGEITKQEYDEEIQSRESGSEE